MRRGPRKGARLRLAPAALLLAALAAWGPGADAAGAGGSDAGKATEGAPAPRTLRFDTPDGFALEASLWQDAEPDAPVAILLHQFNRDRHSFGTLVTPLREAGFTVLALDQRGQGGSTLQKTAEGERKVRIRALPPDRVGALVEAGAGDVQAALSALARSGRTPGGLVLVGASYGCTVALRAAAARADVDAVVLLSPGSAYFGVDALQAARRYRGALLVLAAEDDPVRVSPASAREIAAAHEGPEELEVFAAGGHGVALLEAHPGLADRVAAFARKATQGTAPTARDDR